MLPPLEYLTLFIKSKVTVIMKDGEIYNGLLEGVDNHINIMISDYNENMNNKIMFIRGENICCIGEKI